MKSATLIGGSSHPDLVALIASRLGVTPAPVSLKRFANGETSVVIHQSVRDQDVFIIQSGSKTVNDSLMELLILISACKGGSARRITAVMPYFPYSKQSKMKKYRDAITARMVANLLSVAGVDHVITMDLHASQMQGFFTRPVDNLYAEPNIAEWIRHNVEDWENAVVVSKKPGGAKRVTSLADTLNLDFALINTDKQRSSHLQHSTFMEESFMEESQMEELTIAAPQSHMGRRRVHTSRFIFGHVVDEEFEVDSSRPETPRSECLPSGTMTPIPDETPIYDDDEEEELNAASASICTERMITLVGDVNGKNCSFAR
ncbi:ribose-phosphate pyrophosphokinase [Schizosaccharomyces japonicus yFS275]|uniref:ribose-phosphate diphosphokinase n=1 Tax=Schizosaccharomyces japonicus (strain yFS275 / FY16936) TaxID=402676 RepID=B6K890_SCHJY|nr:ribose-phosphate pyrophosphokinase [Schizosaccharomyces japonicus yFS275]EEB09744.2 ribose-phosphate pyrophosphokinase [Schizosaccharomyces japonicus yFS275]